MSKYNQNPQDSAEDLKFLFAMAGDTSTLTKAEEYVLIAKVQGDDPVEAMKAMDVLVRRNLKLIVKKSRSFTGEGIPLIDLVQEGATGVIRAAEKFDTSRGLKFSTYATPWIAQRMRRAINRGGNLIKISEGKLKELTALKWLYKRLKEDWGRNPTAKELAPLLGITVEKAEELGRMHSPYVPLDKPVGEDENLTLGDYVMDDGPISEETVENNADKEYVQYLLQFLTKDDSEFIKLKYGFVGDREERSDRWMAVYLHIPIKEVQAREQDILAQLQERSSVFRVNLPILTSLELVSVPGDYTETLYTLMRALNITHTDARIMLKVLPVTIKSKCDQHTSLNLKLQLEATGAQVRISAF